jgi:hypothetical protein
MAYTSSADGLRYTHCEGTNGQVSPLCDKERGQLHRRHEVLVPSELPVVTRQTIDESDLEVLADLAKLRPWQRDRLRYWFDHIPYNHL